MLTELYIKNFAIIEGLRVSFGPGLNILSGETGAGKSIIIGAIGLILGGRASADIIRSGEEEAVVEALFDLSGEDAAVASLEAAGVESGDELLVKRVVSRSGKGRVYLNGGLSTVTMLTDLARRLVNIYGQHESLNLLRPENHLELLDGYGGLARLRGEYAALFEEYRRLRTEMQRLDEGERERARRIDLLSFQSAEIGGAGLRSGEEGELLAERQLLSHGERLLRNSSWAFDTLYGGERTVLGLLGEAEARVAEIAAIDVRLAPIAETLRQVAIQLEDAGLSLRDYAARVEADPQRLREVNDRLDLIQRLKKKYAPTLEEVIAFKEETDRELSRLANLEETREGLEKGLAGLRLRLEDAGKALGKEREKTALSLKVAMERELRQLAMRNAVFHVSMEPLDEPRVNGMERVEFLFSSNPGEEPKPLSRIASGGELSRLMLAMKQLHPESDVPTLVFDEVDSGIGGATSALVGRKLKRVARQQQVLCITHLPQVAAFADRHYKVEKGVEEGRTVTRVTPLEGEQRVMEMARMLGGVKIGAKTLEHAREMLDEAAADGAQS